MSALLLLFSENKSKRGQCYGVSRPWVLQTTTEFSYLDDGCYNTTRKSLKQPGAWTMSAFFQNSNLLVYVRKDELRCSEWTNCDLMDVTNGTRSIYTFLRSWRSLQCTSGLLKVLNDGWSLLYICFSSLQKTSKPGLLDSRHQKLYVFEDMLYSAADVQDRNSYKSLSMSAAEKNPERTPISGARSILACLPNISSPNHPLSMIDVLCTSIVRRV